MHTDSSNLSVLRNLAAHLIKNNNNNNTIFSNIKITRNTLDTGIFEYILDYHLHPFGSPLGFLKIDNY